MLASSKAEKIKMLSNLSFQKRRTVLPDYKLQNAAKQLPFAPGQILDTDKAAALLLELPINRARELFAYVCRKNASSGLNIAKTLHDGALIHLTASQAMAGVSISDDLSRRHIGTLTRLRD